MIGHQNIAEQPNAKPFPGLTQHLLESGIIGGLVEQRGTTHRSVKDMVDVTCIRAPMTPRHAHNLQKADVRSRKSNLTPCMFISSHFQ
jgi:hypothetical protein